jgi:hypothetical protein
MYVKKSGKSDRRRSSGDNGATAGSKFAAQGLGMIFFTYMDIYRDCHHDSSQHRQREELA